MPNHAAASCERIQFLDVKLPGPDPTKQAVTFVTIDRTKQLCDKLEYLPQCLTLPRSRQSLLQKVRIVARLNLYSFMWDGHKISTALVLRSTTLGSGDAFMCISTHSFRILLNISRKEANAHGALKLNVACCMRLTRTSEPNSIMASFVFAAMRKCQMVWT